MDGWKRTDQMGKVDFDVQLTNSVMVTCNALKLRLMALNAEEICGEYKTFKESIGEVTNDVKNDIATAALKEEMYDVELLCADGHVVKANRAILAFRSPVLRAMLYGNFEERNCSRINVPDFGSEVC